MFDYIKINKIKTMTNNKYMGDFPPKRQYKV